MKTRSFVVLVLALGMAIVPLFAAQKAEPKADVPKYDLAAEATYKVVVEEVKDRDCPISGGMGSHLMVKLDSQIYEVHLAPTKFVKSYDAIFQKGDVVEIVGTKVKFQGVDAILVRQITRGPDQFVFRDPKGNPIW
jgi:DNA/RNA endonuclease YhcR with UshA esterase domain